MFGIIFDGHPALTRIMMPDDWPGHPQRKDYPLGGIPVEYKGAEIPPPDERRSLPDDEHGRQHPARAPSRATDDGDGRGPRLHRHRRRTGTAVRGGDRRPIGDERIVVNMGPQHPSTHGVLRLILELEGETVTEARVRHRLPAHRHREEHRVPQLDPGRHVRAPGWTTCRRSSTRSPTAWRWRSCSASGPDPGAGQRSIRVMMMELNRIALAPGWPGDRSAWSWARSRSMIYGVPRARERPGHLRADHRAADEPRVHPARRRGRRTCRTGERWRRSGSSCKVPHGPARHRQAAARQPDLDGRTHEASATST